MQLRFKSFQDFVTFGNSDVIATEDDWREVDGEFHCQAESTDGARCGIMVKHTGTPHRFCRRWPHEGYCNMGCYQ